ncbi:tyrosine-type recombinase/integrase [Paracoccus alkanivorans]|nr:tyrosine-type recombinase/integrase [Paracoccus alkanivorans]
MSLSSFPILGMAVRRYLLAHLLFPIRRYVDLAGLQKRANYVSRIASLLGEAHGDMRFRDVEIGHLTTAFNAATRNAPSLRSVVAMYLKEIGEHQRRGAIVDSFHRVSQEQLRALANSGLVLPIRPIKDQEDAYGKYQPLPDAYVAKAGRIWAFYLTEILPNLDNVLGYAPEIERVVRSPRKRVWAGRQGPRDRSTVKAQRSEMWVDFLKDYKWRASDGEVIESIPFNVENEFPPRSQASLMALWAVVQGCLMQCLLLLTGGRVSEIESLKRDCLISNDNDVQAGNNAAERFALPRLVGRTFKLSGLKCGDERDWPIPKKIAKALLIQQNLGRLVGVSEESLWVSNNRAYWMRGRINVYHFTTAFPASHGIEHLLDETYAHPHRFRKTIARLAVLSLSGAPMVLREIFGHSDLEGTMKYILSSPEIRSELADMAVEVQTEQARDVANGLDHAGGKAALHLRKVRDEFFNELRVPQNERQQRRRMEEFVEAKLADDSADLKVLFPGIVCTKPKAAVGACGLRDNVNASSCQATCAYFLALPSLRKETEQTIEWLISQLEQQKIQENPLLRPWYAAQLIDQISIFPGLKEKYRTDPRCIVFTKGLGV